MHLLDRIHWLLSSSLCGFSHAFMRGWILSFYTNHANVFFPPPPTLWFLLLIEFNVKGLRVEVLTMVCIKVFIRVFNDVCSIICIGLYIRMLTRFSMALFITFSKDCECWNNTMVYRLAIWLGLEFFSSNSQLSSTFDRSSYPQKNLLYVYATTTHIYWLINSEFKSSNWTANVVYILH
jgi:hypothetical protein